MGKNCVHQVSVLPSRNLGNFVISQRDRGNDIVMLHNPSIQDFIERYFVKNSAMFERLLKGACFFEQVP
jgi:hypothetical protein